ncbi:MAG TPA: glutamate racemase [Terracidiphilus sp.]|nr:glutamate racemase [Terracidiphilus sp.]
MNPSPTIGVFDSGFGGLTVLRALLARMPAARYVFLGDTARLPYGSKSRRTIARYAAESARFLVHQQGAEFLVIACNTASALALDAIQESVPVPVLGVIQPGAAAARAVSQSGHVLVLATSATVQSRAYSAACQAIGLRAVEKACPLLVPLVEEGWTTDIDTSTKPGASVPALSLSKGLDSETWESTNASQLAVTQEVIRIYLEEVLAAAARENLQPDTLLLGCTHYPLLRPLIEKAVPAGLRVIDSADSTANAAAALINGHLTSQIAAPAGPSTAVRLTESGSPRTGLSPRGVEIRCFATDSVEKFSRLGSRFLGRPVGPVQLIDLGG